MFVRIILAPLFSDHRVHYICNFINTDSSVVPDMLIHLLLDLKTYYTRTSSGMRVNTRSPLFESFYQFVIFPLN